MLSTAKKLRIFILYARDRQGSKRVQFRKQSSSVLFVEA